MRFVVGASWSEASCGPLYVRDEWYMNDPDHVAETQRWLRYADEDISAADAMLERAPFPPRHVCWLAQQAAEKALKAALIFLQVDFPRRHDLDSLRLLVPPGWRVQADLTDLSELTEWAVEARYPGEWPDATAEDARVALSQARRVLAAVAADLADFGVG